MRALADDERGQTTVLVLGIFLVVLGVVAFAVDGTRSFLMRRTLQNAADAAALAGTSELDKPIYYRSGGRRVQLDVDSSEEIARTYLSHRDLDVSAEITADEGAIRVELRAALPSTFLKLIGVESIPVAAAATAEPLSEADL